MGLLSGPEGELGGVRFVQNRLGGWRKGGRRVAIPIEGSEFEEPCDTLLVAIGQKTVNDYLDRPVELDRWGNVRISENGMDLGGRAVRRRRLCERPYHCHRSGGSRAGTGPEDGRLVDGTGAAQAGGQDRGRG